LTPTDNFVVASSSGPLVDSVPATPPDYHGSGDMTVSVAVTASPRTVNSASELMIQQDAAQVLCTVTSETRLFRSGIGCLV
jgi:hypothetical protein